MRTLKRKQLQLYWLWSNHLTFDHWAKSLADIDLSNSVLFIVFGFPLATACPMSSGRHPETRGFSDDHRRWRSPRQRTVSTLYCILPSEINPFSHIKTTPTPFQPLKNPRLNQSSGTLTMQSTNIIKKDNVASPAVVTNPQ